MWGREKGVGEGEGCGGGRREKGVGEGEGCGGGTNGHSCCFLETQTLFRKASLSMKFDGM